ncbi:MAG: hypothetical protein M1836_006759 [Candelina mexicana]|nr:MAG: hypothetical protein M1836_006759 [Candelina mexicana]
MPPKRTLSGSPADSKPGSGVKVAKGENGAPENFSTAVKKRLQTSNRTGQACDRCKIRKIKCDGAQGGCSNCRQGNVDCQTTDRITGRATTRGYVENLEQKNQAMTGKLLEYEARLRSLGIDDFTPTDDPQPAPTSTWNQNQHNADAPWVALNAGTTHNVVPYNTHMPASPATRELETNIFKALPVFRAGLTGDNYCGVASGSSNLSSIRGTALSVLGIEINIADFECPDMDTPDLTSSGNQFLHNKSYQSFLQSAFGVNAQLDIPDLPRKSDGLTFVDWYLRTVNSYVPVLHRKTLVTLLACFYEDPTFKPTPAELVIVHMVMAIMYYQFAARNPGAGAQKYNETSNRHYHYAIGHMYQLMASHTIQDVQALALICIHLRNFPKPGASWTVTNYTMTLALELGLNRSAAAWNQSIEQKNLLEIEIRKRVFWSILLLLVQISSKLGRPMPLRTEDFDIEIPEAIDDELISHEGIDTSKLGKCAFRIGIEAMKLQPLFIELYSTIYGVKRSEQNYIESVRRLDEKLQIWRDNWPTELVPRSETNDQERRVYGAYLASWECEFKLLLHHPAQSLTQSPQFNNTNMEICLEAATSLLGYARELQNYRSLDTTWYKGATYTMAITTTLFGHMERSDRITSAVLAQLRKDMGSWLVVMSHLGELLGSGRRLHDAIHRITDATLIKLSGVLAHKTASAAVASANLSRSRSQSPSVAVKNHANAFSAPFYGPSSQDAHSNIKNEMDDTARRQPCIQSEDPSMDGHTQTPYPAVAQYTYPEPSISSYSGPSNSYHGAPEYSDPSSIDAVVNNAGSQSSLATGPFVFPNNSTSYQLNQVTAGSQSWRQWTSTMADNLEPNLDLNSASALMQLGGRNMGSQGTSQGGAPVADMTGGVADVTAVAGHGLQGADEQSQVWPLSIFSIGQGATSRM